MRGLMIAFCVFFAYITNSMIAHVDAAAYSVLLLDLLLRVQMIANPRKTRNRYSQSKPVLHTYTLYIHVYTSFPESWSPRHSLPCQ